MAPARGCQHAAYMPSNTACTPPISNASLPQAAAATPTPRHVDFSSLRRDRVADLVRIGALGVVIIWHSTLSLFRRGGDGTLSMPNPIGLYPGMWALTWVFQVMPLFFLVSGAVNADSWERHERRGGTAMSFATRRVRQFVAPVIGLVAFSAIAEAISRLVWHTPFLAHHLVMFVPLWTLALLLAYAPLTAALHRGWQRYGVTLTVGLVSVVVMSDLVRFSMGSPAADVAKAVSTLGVWLTAYHLGWVYRAAVRQGRAATKETGRVFTLVGFVGLVVATNIHVYPRSMVATTTDAMSNLLPTTVPVLALAIMQCGLLLLARPTLVSWMDRPRWWARVAACGDYALDAYLLHMIVVVALIFGAEAMGVTFSATPTPLWWVTRPLWLVLVTGALAVMAKALHTVKR